MQDVPARPQAAEQELQELSLGDLFLMLWRGRWLILVCTLGLTAFGFKYAESRGVVWRATSRLYVDAIAPSLLSAETSLVPYVNRNHANTQAELLRSTKVLEQTLLRPEVAVSAVFPPDVNKVAWLRGELKVAVGAKDDIVTVSLDHQQVEDACLVVNSVVDTFRKTHAEKGNSRARELKTIAQTKRDDVQEALDGLHGDLIQFLEDNAAISLNDSAGSTYSTARLEAAFLEWKRLDSELRTVSQRLTLARELQDTPELVRELLGATKVAAPRVASRVTELQLTSALQRAEELEARIRENRDRLREQLELGRTTEFPAVVALERDAVQLQQDAAAARQTVADLELQITQTQVEAERAFASSLIASLAVEEADLKAREAAAREQFEALEVEATSVAPRRAELRRLETRIAQSEAIIEGLNQEINNYAKADIGLEERSNITIEVLDRAAPDSARPVVSKTKTIGTFFLLGGVLGCGLAWLRSLLDRRVRSEEDITRATGLSLIGALPRTRIREQKVDAIQTFEDHPGMAEAARGLRTALVVSLPKGRGRVIHVTSADKGDGKSTSTSQLAIALARGGQRVLVIDADLRSPRISKIFHIGNESGLSNILAQGLEFDEVVRPTRVEGLDLLPSGPIPVNPAELLNADGFVALLKQVTKRYDRILIDSPPVLAVSDSRVVAIRADVTILVARVDRTNRSRLAAALERLTSVGAKVLGVVMNDVPRGIGYGYCYGYGQYTYGDQVGVDLAHDAGAVADADSAAAENSLGRQRVHRNGAEGNAPVARRTLRPKRPLEAQAVDASGADAAAILDEHGAANVAIIGVDPAAVDADEAEALAEPLRADGVRPSNPPRQAAIRGLKAEDELGAAGGALPPDPSIQRIQPERTRRRKGG